MRLAAIISAIFLFSCNNKFIIDKAQRATIIFDRNCSTLIDSLDKNWKFSRVDSCHKSLNYGIFLESKNCLIGMTRERLHNLIGKPTFSNILPSKNMSQDEYQMCFKHDNKIYKYEILEFTFKNDTITEIDLIIKKTVVD